MKILAINSRERSTVAMILHNNGGFIKDKNRFIAKHIEITFMKACAVNEHTHEAYETVVGIIPEKVKAKIPADKLSEKSLMALVKEALFGIDEVFRIYFNGNKETVEVEVVKIFGNETDSWVRNQKNCYRDKKDAIMAAYIMAKQYREMTEKRLKFFEKQEKDYERALKSF